MAEHRILRVGPKMSDAPPRVWIEHRPCPGPLYWDYRCLICGEDVNRHASWLRRLVRRLRRG